MSRARKPLSFNKEAQTEAKLEEFVLQGINNRSGEPAWSKSNEIEVEIDRILLPSFQIRSYYDRAKIEQIKATILSFGIREPLLLRPHPSENGYFELVAGFQRRRASIELNRSTVPAKIDEVDDLTALKIGIIENEARSDPNPYEKARALLKVLELGLNKSPEEIVQALIAMFNSENRGTDNNVIINPEQNKIIRQIFSELGINWKSFVTNQLPLFKLPDEIKNVLEAGKIEYTKAIKISKINDRAARTRLLEEVLEHGLSVREINAKINQINTTQTKNEVAALRERARSVLKKATSPKLMKDPQNIKQIKKIIERLESLIEKSNKTDRE